MLKASLFLCLLNATLIFSDGGCFSLKEPDKPRLGPTLLNCFTAVSYIPSSTQKSKAPIMFSHDPSKGYKVPKTWVHGDCAIEIDLIKGVDGEVATFDNLGNIALGLAIVCVEKTAPHLGGLAQIGSQGSLEVVVVRWGASGRWGASRNSTISLKTHGVSQKAAID